MCLHFYRLRKLTSLSLWGPELLAVWDICFFLFWVFAFVVPCLNIASSERPFLSTVTSSCPPSPSSKSLPPGFLPFVALTGLRDGLSSPFAYCLFLTCDSRAHQSRNAVCSVLIALDIQVNTKHAAILFWLNEWMNEFIKDCQKNNLFRLDTVFDFYRFKHIRFSLGFSKRVSHWNIILLFFFNPVACG